MEQQTVTIAKAGIHVSLNARCSVLAAANPIYGQYQSDISASRNIGFPDSLLSRFDLCFIVLDEHSSELDRRISEKVIDNHMFTIDAAKFGDDAEDKVIEPEIKIEENKKTQMYEKNNPNSATNKERKHILTRDFLRKYIHYAKSKINPELTRESTEFISKSWSKLRERTMNEDLKRKIVPITVRTLESLIRIATAFAKARLSQKVEREDAENALELLANSLFHESDVIENNEEESQMDLVEEEEPQEKKQKKESTKKTNTIPLEEDEEEEEKSERKKRSKKRSKKSKDKKEIEELITAQVVEEDDKDDDDFDASEDLANATFKFIYENARKKKNQTIELEELWNIIKGKKEIKDKKMNKINKLKKVCVRLEDEGKIFISENDEITLV